MKKLIFTLLFLCLAPLAEAADRYASPTGTGTTCSTTVPCSTTTAASQALSGEAIVLKNGTFLNTTITTVRSGVTIRAENPQKAIVVCCGSGFTWVAHIRHSSTTVQDVIWDGNKSNPSAIMRVSPVTGTAAGTPLTNTVIEGNVFRSGGGGAVLFQQVNGADYRFNEVHSMGWKGPGEGLYMSTTTAADTHLTVNNLRCYSNLFKGTTQNALDYKRFTTNVDCHHNILENHESQADRAGAPAYSNLDGIIRSEGSASVTGNLFRDNIVRNSTETTNLSVMRLRVRLDVKDNVFHDLVTTRFAESTGSTSNPHQVTGNIACATDDDITTDVAPGTAIFTGSTFNRPQAECDTRVATLIAEMKTQTGNPNLRWTGPMFDRAETISTTKIQILFVNNNFPPIKNPDGSKCTVTEDGVGRAVNPIAAIVGTNILELDVATLSGGTALLVTCTAGAVTDSANIVNQDINVNSVAFTSQSVENKITAPPDVFSREQAAVRWEDIESAEQGITLNAPGNVLRVTPKSAFRLRANFKVTGDDSPPFGVLWQYNLNGSAYTNVPNTAGADDIQFYGLVDTHSNVVSANSPTTCQLDTDSACVPGMVVRTADAVPNLTLAEGEVAEIVYLMSLISPTPGDLYCFKAINQTGADLDVYTGDPPCILVVNHQAHNQLNTGAVTSIARVAEATSCPNVMTEDGTSNNFKWNFEDAIIATGGAIAATPDSLAAAGNALVHAAGITASQFKICGTVAAGDYKLYVRSTLPIAPDGRVVVSTTPIHVYNPVKAGYLGLVPDSNYRWYPIGCNIDRDTSTNTTAECILTLPAAATLYFLVDAGIKLDQGVLCSTAAVCDPALVSPPSTPSIAEYTFQRTVNTLTIDHADFANAPRVPFNNTANTNTSNADLRCLWKTGTPARGYCQVNTDDADIVTVMTTNDGNYSAEDHLDFRWRSPPDLEKVSGVNLREVIANFGGFYQDGTISPGGSATNLNTTVTVGAGKLFVAFDLGTVTAEALSACNFNVQNKDTNINTKFKMMAGIAATMTDLANGGICKFTDTLVAGSAPSTPTAGALTSSNITDQSVTITWDYDTGSANDGDCKAKYRISGSGATFSETAISESTGGTCSRIITGLTQALTYEIIGTSQNSIGVSDDSSAITVMMSYPMFWVDGTNGSNANPCTLSATPLSTGAKQTLAAGRDCLKGGQTLTLRAGTYPNNFDFDNGGLALPSGPSSVQPTIIRAHTGETVTLTCPGSTGSHNCVMLSNRNNITFDGLTLDPRIGGARGVTFLTSGTNNITFKNGRAFGNGDSIFGQLGLSGTQNTNLQILDSEVAFGGNDNIYLSRCNNCTVLRSWVHGSAASGVQIFYQPGTPTQQNIAIRENLIEDNAFRCVFVSVIDGADIAHNICRDNGGPTVSRATILTGTHRTTTNIRVYNNTVYNNVVSSTTGSAPNACISVDTGSATVRNNVCMSNTPNNNIGANGGTITQSNNASAVFTTGVVVDAANGDFHPTSGSTLRNGGLNVGLPFLGSAPDIGAVEFVE